MSTAVNASDLATQPVRRSLDPSTIAWMRLARVYQKIDYRTANLLRCHGISVGRFDVLNHAGTPEGRTQQELAESLLVTKGNITQLLDAMERDGLIERRRAGRSKRIYLTEPGRRLRTRLVELQEAALAEDFSILTEDEVETLMHLLRKLDRGLSGPHGELASSSPDEPDFHIPQEGTANGSTT